MEYYIYEWRDVSHYLSGEKPDVIPCWFHPCPMNQIKSIREGRETLEDLRRARRG